MPPTCGAGLTVQPQKNLIATEATQIQRPVMRSYKLNNESSQLDQG